MNIRSVSRLFIPDKAFTDPVINEGCYYFEVNNWLLSQFVVERLVPLVGFHPFPLNEQMLMAAAVCRVRPTHILEWGTNIGASARIFHEICRTFSVKAEINSIDLPDHERHVEHPRQKRGQLVRGIPKVRLHQGDGLTVALDILACTTEPARALFFLDGDHGYDSVRHELVTIISKVPDASILVHDTFCQSEESGYNTGPYRAVQDVLIETASDFKIYSQDIGLPGMTFLWTRT